MKSREKRLASVSQTMGETLVKLGASDRWESSTRLRRQLVGRRTVRQHAPPPVNGLLTRVSRRDECHMIIGVIGIKANEP